MTYEEAIECINEVLISDYLYDESIDYQLTSYDFDWLDKAKEALEKQMPKKPVYKDELFLGKPCKVPYCPTCGDSWNGNEYGECMKYCWDCGQAIDWGDDNEL